MSLRRVSLCAFLLGAHARAAPVPGGEVRVERSETALDCPTEAELVRSARALGTAPDDAATPGSSVVVRFERDAAGYRAHLSSSGQKTGERELATEDTDCRRLADAVAVVVAVLLDLVPPEAAASFEVPPASVPPSAAPAPVPPPVPLTAPEPPKKPPAPPPRKRTDVTLRAEAALAVGLLGAAVSPTVGGALAVTHGRWQAALGGFWVVPRRVPFDELADTSVLVTLALGSADGCYRFGGRPHAWESWICGRFLAGVIGGDGRGFDHHYPTHEPWFGAGPAFALRLPLTRAFALRFGATGIVTLGKHTFAVQDYGAAFQSPPVSASVSFGPELTIW